MFYIAYRGEIMLDMTSQISKGITFIRLEGELTTNNFYKIAEEINYLLYKQGMIAYVFNLKKVKRVDKNILGSMQNKLTEIDSKTTELNEQLDTNTKKIEEKLGYIYSGTVPQSWYRPYSA